MALLPVTFFKQLNQFGELRRVRIAQIQSLKGRTARGGPEFMVERSQHTSHNIISAAR